jgi:hypothetical protein
MAAQKTWTRIRPLFKREFATTSDHKLIVDRLANLAHRQGEIPRKFFEPLEKLFNVLHENYASYRIKPDRPAQLQDGHYSEDALTQYAKDSAEAYNKFLFAQVFKATAPENVCKLLSHKDQTRLTVDEAYKHSSQSTGWNKTNASQQPSMCMHLRIIRIKTLPTWILMWLHSGHNVHHNNSSASNRATIMEIAQGDKISTEATTTAMDHPRIKATMLPEMVNFVFSARSSTTHKKNAAKELTIRNLA